MVVGRLLCFSQEVGAKVYQQANLVEWLKTDDREREPTQPRTSRRAF